MNIPTIDGQHLVFRPSHGCGRAGAGGAVIVYVNGMMTDGPTHAATARLIANIVGTSVHGIYNLSGGAAHQLVEDLRESARSASEAARDAARAAAAEAARVKAASSEFAREIAERERAFETQARRFTRLCESQLSGVSEFVVCGSITVTRATIDVAAHGVSDFVRGVGRATSVSISYFSSSVDYVARRGGAFVEHALESGGEKARFLDDGLQALTDWTKLLRAGSDAHWDRWLSLPRNERRTHVRELLKGNPATLSLFNLLDELLRSSPTLHLVAHSQGNLISSAAISALALVHPRRNMPLHVYALASPAVWWPHVPGLASFQSFDNPEDPVAQLDLALLRRANPSWSSVIGKEIPVKTGPHGADPHSVTDTYLAKRSPVIKALCRGVGVSMPTCAEH